MTIKLEAWVLVSKAEISARVEELLEGLGDRPNMPAARAAAGVVMVDWRATTPARARIGAQMAAWIILYELTRAGYGAAIAAIRGDRAYEPSAVRSMDKVFHEFNVCAAVKDGRPDVLLCLPIEFAALGDEWRPMV